MSQTVNALAIKLTTEVGESTDDAEYVSLVEEWINDGVKFILNAGEWKFVRKTQTVDLIADTRTYLIANTILEITAGRFADTDEPLEYFAKELLIGRGVDLELVSETPRIFYWESFNEATDQYELGFWPVPSTARTVELTTQLRVISLASNATIPLPPELEVTLKDYVRAEQAYDDENESKGNRFANRFASGLSLLLGRLNKEPAENSRLSTADIPFRNGRLPQQVRFDPNHFTNVAT